MSTGVRRGARTSAAPDRIAAVTSRRFLTLADVAEVLNTSANQVYALVRSGELPAIKIGGRGQWRVEEAELDGYIARMYEQTRRFVADHPFGTAGAEESDGVTAE